MAKIPFDIKFRPQIESGEYKVETFSGYPVSIYRWDFDDGARTPIMGSYVFEDSKEYVGAWNEEGHFEPMSPNDLDLFIVTPEEELTEFEKAIKDMIKPYAKWPDDIFKEESAKLLSLAREQFIKDGYVIEKKAFHDAVKRVDPGIMKEVSKNVDMTEYEKGRADALKDLPRWRKAKEYKKLGLDDFCFTLDNDGKMSPYWDTEIEKAKNKAKSGNKESAE